ncbi:hypothetical protein RvY_02444 [Ramazzottius varieornatus]|uniref:Uncharacterized protein n=1 Tax=Ramazzottius varieornatus TaxID=947166 RepID=A0A1D1UJP9_RAMVA|nr:hypothetical protein RvY_02444 [Ramazzottius varieornatus]
MSHFRKNDRCTLNILASSIIRREPTVRYLASPFKFHLCNRTPHRIQRQRVRDSAPLWTRNLRGDSTWIKSHGTRQYLLDGRIVLTKRQMRNTMTERGQPVLGTEAYKRGNWDSAGLRDVEELIRPKTGVDCG